MQELVQKGGTPTMTELMDLKYNQNGNGSHNQSVQGSQAGSRMSKRGLHNI